MSEVSRPSGRVTFLFTDVEGSTRRWEANPDDMQLRSAEHDEVLRTAIESHGGYLFRRTGDGVCAAFSSPVAAAKAAIDSQLRLDLPVRMGLATGDARCRDDDYYGSVLNRTARVMEVGHGGQILMTKLTASLVSGIDLVDLGEHRLRDISGSERLFQIRSNGLESSFPKLKTVDAVPGNLRAQTTSFVGREMEVKELAEQIHQHRLVTLTGIGGVGKTRLANELAAQLAPEFRDGVWFVELAPIGDPRAVPDAIATTLGVTIQADMLATASIAETLAGRHLLLVIDNCEHVLDAAAEVIDQILAASTAVSIVATSREGLRVHGEHLWPVPSLSVDGGAASPAVELFVERAEAVVPGFALDSDAAIEATIEICRRLDGIALAIELAAARMVSMTPIEVAGRLHDRFRLLAGSRRGLEHHHTLRQAVQWSYDLLTSDERVVLGACAVFAGGFDLAAVTAVCGEEDDYATLHSIESLVRKSLITIDQTAGRTRYGLLETIRHFAEDQNVADATAQAETSRAAPIEAMRDRHARYYADLAMHQFDLWRGAGMSEAARWVELEFDNLRAGFGWASSNDVGAATAIAAHVPMIAFAMQRLEPVAWAEELIDAAVVAQVPHLPRLYTSASLCSYLGRHEAALAYAQRAVALHDQHGYEPFDYAWVAFREAVAHLDDGRPGRYIEICSDLVERDGLAHVVGMCGLTAMLTSVGRGDEAIALAPDTLAAAKAHGHPYWIAFAHVGAGRALSGTDPNRALAILQAGLAYAQKHPIPYWEAVLAREVGGLEAVHGDPGEALDLLGASLESFHRAGNTATLAWSLANLAVLFERTGDPETAATLYGATTKYQIGGVILGLPDAVDRLQNALDSGSFENCIAKGASMNPAEAVNYAQQHIAAAASKTQTH